MSDSEPPPGRGKDNPNQNNQKRAPAKVFPSYSSIAAINTFVRNKKNIREVRLEKLD